MRLVRFVLRSHRYCRRVLIHWSRTSRSCIHHGQRWSHQRKLFSTFRCRFDVLKRAQELWERCVKKRVVQSSDVEPSDEKETAVMMETKAEIHGPIAIPMSMPFVDTDVIDL